MRVVGLGNRDGARRGREAIALDLHLHRRIRGQILVPPRVVGHAAPGGHHDAALAIGREDERLGTRLARGARPVVVSGTQVSPFRS
jgi:hypothetical protein